MSNIAEIISEYITTGLLPTRSDKLPTIGPPKTAPTWIENNANPTSTGLDCISPTKYKGKKTTSQFCVIDQNPASTQSINMSLLARRSRNPSQYLYLPDVLPSIFGSESI